MSLSTQICMETTAQCCVSHAMTLWVTSRVAVLGRVCLEGYRNPDSDCTATECAAEMRGTVSLWDAVIPLSLQFGPCSAYTNQHNYV